MIKILLLSLCILPLFAQQFIIDTANSKLAFKIRHLQITDVIGSFKNYESKISYDGEYKEFKELWVKIKASSIKTDNETRDQSLQGRKYFNTKIYPFITFKMSKYEKTSQSTGLILGYLSINSMSKLVKLRANIKEIDFIDIDKSLVKTLAFSIKGIITRTEFDFSQRTSDLLIGNKIWLNIEVLAHAK